MGRGVRGAWWQEQQIKKNSFSSKILRGNCQFESKQHYYWSGRISLLQALPKFALSKRQPPRTSTTIHCRVHNTSPVGSKHYHDFPKAMQHITGHQPVAFLLANLNSLVLCSDHHKFHVSFDRNTGWATSPHTHLKIRPCPWRNPRPETYETLMAVHIDEMTGSKWK